MTTHFVQDERGQHPIRMGQGQGQQEEPHFGKVPPESSGVKRATSNIPIRQAARQQNAGVSRYLNVLTLWDMATRVFLSSWWLLPLTLGLMALLIPTMSTYHQMPPSLLDHYEHGKFISIEGSNNKNLNIFVREEFPTKFQGQKAMNEAVVMLHGVPTASYEWRNMLKDVAEKAGVRAIAFDWPGLGFSDKPPDQPYDFHYFSEILYKMANALRLEKIHLVLHDISGPIGVEFAINHPRLVASITFGNTLMDVHDFRQPFPMSSFGINYLREFAFAIQTNKLFSPLNWLIWKWRLANKVDLQAVQSYGYLLQQNGGKDSFFKIMKNFDLTPEYGDSLRSNLQRLKIPLQVVWVDNDVIPRSDHQLEYIKTNFKDQLKKETVLKSKHLPQEDAPTEFAQSIAKFVQSIG